MSGSDSKFKVIQRKILALANISPYAAQFFLLSIPNLEILKLSLIFLNRDALINS